MLIHHEGPHVASSVVHEGVQYDSLGEPGERGYGVFDVPHHVAHHLIEFPGWKLGDQEGFFTQSLTIKEPVVLPSEDDHDEESENEDDEE